MKRVSMSGIYSAKRSAQGYLCASEETGKLNAACGSACSASEDSKPDSDPEPSACGSACGASEK